MMLSATRLMPHTIHSSGRHSSPGATEKDVSHGMLQSRPLQPNPAHQRLWGATAPTTTPLSSAVSTPSAAMGGSGGGRRASHRLGARTASLTGGHLVQCSSPSTDASFMNGSLSSSLMAPSPVYDPGHRGVAQGAGVVASQLYSTYSDFSPSNLSKGHPHPLAPGTTPQRVAPVMQRSKGRANPPGQIAPSHSGNRGGGSTAKKPAAVNYNLLLQQELQQVDEVVVGTSLSARGSGASEGLTASGGGRGSGGSGGRGRRSEGSLAIPQQSRHHYYGRSSPSSSSKGELSLPTTPGLSNLGPHSQRVGMRGSPPPLPTLGAPPAPTAAAAAAAGRNAAGYYSPDGTSHRLGERGVADRLDDRGLGDRALQPPLRPLPISPPPSDSIVAMEGPLPPDVRRLIAQHCQDTSFIHAAEQQARRLLSTSRRVKVYRDELHAAEEEKRDLVGVVEQHSLVHDVLVQEMADLDARMQTLMQERQLCESQLRNEDEVAARDHAKLLEAQERVRVLKETIDGIEAETTVARLSLQQQVPSLHLENYV